MENKKNKVVELKNITKIFGRIVANKDVNLDLYKGEILSVLGENGSGKTTAMNILSGIYAQDEGSIYMNGEPVSINSPHDALVLGIGMVHQHFKLVDVFTTAENVLVGLSKKDYINIVNKGNKNLSGFNVKEVAKSIETMCDKYGFVLDPNKKVYNMTVGEKQTLEIIKALYRNADILILDEPTAVLTPQETEHLFNVIRNMRKDGKSIVIITHKLNEVIEISDRVAIFRKGHHIATVDTDKTTIKELTDMMVGERLNLEIDRTEPKDAEDRLIVKNLFVKNNDGPVVVNDVSFVAKSGEILGIAGISGNGQKELLEAIQGLRTIEAGDVILRNPKENRPATFFHKTLRRIKELGAKGAFHDPEGNPINFKGMKNREIIDMVNEEKVLFNEDEIIPLKGKNPLQIRELGVRLSFVPEDRLGMGLVGNMNLVDNVMLRSYRHGHWIFLDREKPKNLAERIIDELKVATPNAYTNVSKLSGGNVQKVLVGREIALAPKVFMAAYPVRGLDINSSYMIYNLLEKQKREGIAVIYVGEDLDVLLALCDRIVVLCDGEISGIVNAREVTKEQIGEMMTRKQGVQL